MIDCHSVFAKYSLADEPAVTLFRNWFGEQSGLPLRLVGDAFELWIVMAQWLGDLYLFSSEQINELKRVDDAFALKMIIGHHES